MHYLCYVANYVEDTYRVLLI